MFDTYTTLMKSHIRDGNFILHLTVSWLEWVSNQLRLGAFNTSKTENAIRYAQIVFVIFTVCATLGPFFICLIYGCKSSNAAIKYGNYGRGRFPLTFQIGYKHHAFLNCEYLRAQLQFQQEL